MQKKKRVGLYLDPRVVLQNPGYLEALQDAVGLNLIILSYTGQLSQDVLALNPFDGLPPSDERIRSLITRDIYGRIVAKSLEPAQTSLGPHMGRHGDDAELRRAILEIHSKGIEVWLLGGVWQGSDYKLLGYCPSKEENNRWYEALFCHMAKEYGADGVDVTHARYAMTSEPAGLWTCACPDCVRTAAELGYDMGQMVADIKAAYARLRHMDGRRLVQAMGMGMGFFDAMQALALRDGVWQWFEFRARLLGRNLKRFRAAVHAVAGDGFIFGADTYPASQSMFVGHDISHWGDFSDFASPLLSHADIFCTKAIHDWAQFLLRMHPEIGEGDALQVIYRLLGYDNLGMPDNLADFALDAPDREFRNIPLVDVITRDMAKTRLYLGGDVPSYPIIQGGGAPSDWPRPIIDALVASAEQTGHDGVIFQGTKMLVGYNAK